VPQNETVPPIGSEVGLAVRVAAPVTTETVFVLPVLSALITSWSEWLPAVVDVGSGTVTVRVVGHVVVPVTGLPVKTVTPSRVTLGVTTYDADARLDQYSKLTELP
jgi:hypothetical protein